MLDQREAGWQNRPSRRIDCRQGQPVAGQAPRPTASRSYKSSIIAWSGGPRATTFRSPRTIGGHPRPRTAGQRFLERQVLFHRLRQGRHALDDPRREGRALVAGNRGDREVENCPPACPWRLGVGLVSGESVGRKRDSRLPERRASETQRLRGRVGAVAAPAKTCVPLLCTTCPSEQPHRSNPTASNSQTSELLFRHLLVYAFNKYTKGAGSLPRAAVSDNSRLALRIRPDDKALISRAVALPRKPI